MSNNQKEIGALLIEMNNRNIDRFFSLIEITLVVITLYTSIVLVRTNILDSLKVINWNLMLCIIPILIAIYYSINQIQDNGKIPILFKENSGVIQYKSEQEISEQNRTLFSSIKTQNDTFICSIMLIICSLGFSFSYLFPEDSTPLKPALFWVFLALFVISIAYKYQENIKKLFGNQESKIPEQ